MMRMQRIQMNDAWINQRDFLTYKKKFKRQRELQRKILLVILTVALLINGMILYHTIQSYANTDLENVSFKYYSSIMVNYGDSLWSIADTYCDEHYESKADYIAEVVHINHLLDDKITAGQYLIIPYYSDEFIK